MPTLRGVSGAVLLTLLTLIVLATGQSDSGFIRVSGTQFVDRQCRPFVYSGWNSWALLEAAGQVSAALPRNSGFLNGASYLDYKLDVAKENGLTVGRVFAHGHDPSVLALQLNPGVYNDGAWAALDRLLDAAAQRDLKLILTLSDNWKNVDSRGAYAQWAGIDAGEFYTNDDTREWYKNHISVMVNRQNSINGRLYKEDPAIFAWNLMNEPRCDCSIRSFSDACKKPCADSIQGWIEEMSAFLKSEDPLHLVTVGEEGFYGLQSGREGENPDQEPTAEFSGLALEDFMETFNTSVTNWAARSGQDFVRNHAPESIDYAAAHLWPDNWGGLPIDFQARWIEAHAKDAASLQKPLTIEEFGKIAGNSEDEIKNVRDPYIKNVYDTFDRLKSSYPMSGIAFWEFDGKILDSPAEYNVYPTHSTFTDIIVPATQKIVEDQNAMPVLENCFPGEIRSYDALTVEETIYITAGLNLLATDEGMDVSEELEAAGIEVCLAECEGSRRCNSASFNKNRKACFLKNLADSMEVEVAWNADGWQTYWKAPTETA